MKAIDELARLAARIADGSIPSDEPLFILRAQDTEAAATVRFWACKASLRDSPGDKVDEANGLANLMDEWPVKQVPGRPDTVRRCNCHGGYGVCEMHGTNTDPQPTSEDVTE